MIVRAGAGSLSRLSVPPSCLRVTVVLLVLLLLLVVVVVVLVLVLVPVLGGRKESE